MATHVKTHTYITPANPTLKCEECHERVERWPAGDGVPPTNLPCGHHAGYYGDPEWSPV